MVYVEVKGTTQMNKDFFEVSRNELAFAEQQRQQYQVWRPHSLTGRLQVEVFASRDLLGIPIT